MGRAMDFAEGKSNVERALNTDPYSAAEKITGKSYKDDAVTEEIGHMLHIEHAHDKQALLSEADDTYRSMPWLQFVRIAEEEGFIIDDYEEYRYTKYGDDINLHKMVAVHPDGILLFANSYGFGGSDRGEVLNSAYLYYNLKFDKGAENPYRAVSSGGVYHVDGEPVMIRNPNYDPDKPTEYDEKTQKWTNHERMDNPAWDDKDKRVWVGNSYVLEGLRFKLRRLREVGTFLKPWAVMPWLHDNLNLMEEDAKEKVSRPRSEEDWTAEHENMLKTYESAPLAYALMVNAHRDL